MAEPRSHTVHGQKRSNQAHLHIHTRSNPCCYAVLCYVVLCCVMSCCLHTGIEETRRHGVGRWSVLGGRTWARKDTTLQTHTTHQTTHSATYDTAIHYTRTPQRFATHHDMSRAHHTEAHLTLAPRTPHTTEQSTTADQTTAGRSQKYWF